MNKKIWIIGGIAVLVAVILGWIVWGGSTAAGGYKTEAVTRGDISVVITATGKVNPVTRVQVGTQITGTISRIFADFNQKVRKGQEIAEIDPTFLKAQLLEAEANAEKAKAQVEQSKKTLDRATELFDRKLISQSEKDEALTNYNLAGAQYK
ncbi:MAG TPA: biotin/lipoyl-binding protein, partial [bacterium]|nr:biotin/lipoyl-binding protein [bacterium]